MEKHLRLKRSQKPNFGNSEQEGIGEQDTKEHWERQRETQGSI